MDKFILFNLLTDYGKSQFEYVRQGMENSFLISLDVSEKTFKSDKDIINDTFSFVLEKAQGYSIKELLYTIFPEYTHQQIYCPSNIIEHCEQELKLYCILSCLYTFSYLSERNIIPFIEVAKQYKDKRYQTLDDYDLKPSNFKGYHSDFNKTGDQLRTNYDRLFSHVNPIAASNLPNNNKKTQKIFRFLKDVIDTPIYCKKRPIYSFLDEFTYDLIVNNMNFGGHIGYNIDTLLNSQPEKDYYRKTVLKFTRNLKIIDTNFQPLKKTTTSYSLLYDFKKQSLFHTNFFKKIINTPLNSKILSLTKEYSSFPSVISYQAFDELIDYYISNNSIEHAKFLIKFLTDITFPLFTHCLFIVLCDVFNNNFVSIKNELENYLDTLNNVSLDSSDNFNLDNVRAKKSDILGDCIQNIFSFSYPTSSPAFDFMPIPSQHIDLNDPHISLIQSDIAVDYYETIIG